MPLVTLTADIHLNANSSPPGLSFAGEGVTFNAHAQIDGHIVIGYDTYGIREAIRDLTKDPGAIGGDIFDGIYVTAGPAAQGGTTFSINGGIDAGPELSFGIFDLALQGGIDTSTGGPDPQPGPVSSLWPIRAATASFALATGQAGLAFQASRPRAS